MNDMNEKLALANKPITLWQQIRFSMVQVAGNPLFTIMMSFLTFYYTDVLGINPAIIGTVLLLCKIFDGITDVTAGYIIENTHTKVGSARPWILRFAIPMAASLVLLFTVPDCGTTGKLIYIFVSYNFAMSICFTMYGNAANSIPIYGTNDVKSRSSAFAFSTIVAGLVQMVLVTFFMNFVAFFGGDKRAWIIISIILAAISIVASLIAYYSIPENANPHLFKTDEDEEKKEENKIPLMVSLKALVQNKYWLLVLLFLLFLLFHQVATLSVGVYYATWVLNDTLLTGKIALYHSGAVTVATFITPILVNKGIAKKTICVLCTIMMLLGGVLGMVAGTSLTLFYVSLILRGAGYGLIASVLFGMFADTLVYGEWKTGIPTPAIGMCAYQFAQKVMSGVVTAVFGLVLGFVGYDGLALSQPESAITFIKVFFLYAPAILYIGQLIVLHFYKLDNEMPKILEDLAKRRSEQV